MSRHAGWRRLSGDTAARPDLLDLGKKLLGYLAEQRRLSGVSTLSIERSTADGSVVRARYIGELPVIEVRAARPQAPREPQPRFQPSGFVVTARTEALPNGIDDEYPQQILAFRDGQWWTFWGEETTPGYGAFTGPKGTYGQVFRDGLGNAGNIDWIGAMPEGGTDADRVRLNWYGPMRRYWYDGWRRPQAQYGRWVFCNSRVVLDIDEVNAERVAAEEEPYAETLVLGAAYRDGSLYVMQARINDFGTEATTIPDRAGFPTGQAGGVTPQYPDGDTDLRLVRYRVGPGARVIGRGETLWTHTGRGLVNPWVFNPAATVAETFAMPDNLRYMRWISGSAPAVTEVLPSESSDHIRLELGHDDEVDPTITALSIEVQIGDAYPFGTPTGLQHEASGVIAADFTPDGERRELIYTSRRYNSTSTPSEHQWIWDTVRIDDTPEVSVYDVTPGEIVTFDLSVLSLVDIRFGVIVTDGYDNGRVPTGNQQRYTSKVYVDGIAVHTEQGEVGSFWLGVAQIRSQASASTIPCSPLYLLDGVALYYEYGELFGDSSGSTLTIGRPSMYLPVNVPASERRGSVGMCLTSQATMTFVYQFWGMDSGDAPLSLEPQDARGYRTPCSLACDGERILASRRCFLLSGGYGGRYGPWGAPAFFRREGRPTDPAVFFTSHYATGTSLPALTDVGGDGARYAPIWQLGAFPQPS